MRTEYGDALHRIMEKLKDPKGYREATEILDDLLKSTNASLEPERYLRILKHKIDVHMLLANLDMENSKSHFEKIIECHRTILGDVFSYIDPHQRIHSEYAIEHIVLEMHSIREKKNEIEAEMSKDA